VKIEDVAILWGEALIFIGKYSEAEDKFNIALSGVLTLEQFVAIMTLFVKIGQKQKKMKNYFIKLLNY